MIRDFPCTYLQSGGAEVSVLEKSSLPFPDVHLYARPMAELALEVRQQTGAGHCLLPFCHTVEAQAHGAVIHYGDRTNGPRVREYCCRTVDDLLALPAVDFSQGRIAQVLQAGKILSDAGENVVLEVTGPFTMLNSLMDPARIFRALRKEPEKMAQVFARMGEFILQYVQEAQAHGIRTVSYADPTGGVSIIGPKLAEQVAVEFTLPLLHRMDAALASEMLINLCPKTAFALLDTGCAKVREIAVCPGLSYSEACQAVRGKIRYTGMTCIKNTGFKLADTMQYLHLKLKR